MTGQRLQVFVSSKMQELAAERDAIKAALAEMEIDTFAFEHDAGAQSQSIQQTFLQGVETADLYVGLFWKGYGVYTIEEFEHARMLGMDCLIYEKREGEGAGRDPALQHFLDEIGEVEAGLTAKWFHTVEKLRDSVKKDVARWQTRIIRERLSTTKPTIYVGVPSMTNHFVGRDEIMAEMVGRLRSGHDQALSAAGLAGVGKTTLAVALCRHKGMLRHFSDGVLWGGLGTKPDVTSVLTRWGDALGTDISGLASDAEKSQAVRDAIGTRHMLIVIDDAWDLTPAQLLQCGGPGCSHVVTTRNEEIAQAFAGSHSQRKIPVLTEEAAYQLLWELAPAVCDEDEASARELTASLGGLPLAIELVGSYLGAPTHTKFRSQREKARDVASDPLERLQLAKERLGSGQAAKVSLQAVVEMSLEGLDPEAVGAFFALGAFAPKPETFDLAAAEAVAQVDADTLAALSVRNLVDISGEEKLSLHQVVAAVAREGMEAETVAYHRRYYLGLLDEDREDWRRIEHIYGQVKWAWEATDEDAFVMALIWATRTYKRRRGLRTDELAWYERGLDVARAAGNRRDEAAILNEIGDVYDNLGRSEEALRYLERALPIFEEVGDQVGAAASLTNIGRVYDNLGRREEALQYYKRSLPIREEVGDRAGEATTLNNIGIVYDRLGRREEALRYYKRALSISEEVGDRAGEARTLSNIGRVYGNLGQPEEALRYLERALPIREEVGERAGEAMTLSNIGVIYARLGQPEEALRYLERALPIFEEVDDRVRAAATLTNIGAVHDNLNLGQPEEALRYYERALSIFEEVGDQVGVARTLNNIGRVYGNLGQPEEALRYYERALSIFEEVGDQVGAAATLTNIGAVCEDLGRREEALQYYKRSLPIREEVGDRYGESITRYNMAMFYRAQGELERAIIQLRAVVELERQVQHPDLESDLALLKEVEAEWAARGE